MCEVGDGASDHYCWERPEDMTTSRTAYSIDEQHPGSDLAAETAAALAAAATAFNPYNSSYSSLLLLHAKQVHIYIWTPTPTPTRNWFPHLNHLVLGLIIVNKHSLFGPFFILPLKITFLVWSLRRSN